MKVMIETATGRRTPSGVMTSGMPASVQAANVHRIVADAEPRHDTEAAAPRDAVPAEAVREQDQRVDLLELLGPEGVLDLEVLDADAGRSQ